MWRGQRVSWGEGAAALNSLSHLGYFWKKLDLNKQPPQVILLVVVGHEWYSWAVTGMGNLHGYAFMLHADFTAHPRIDW